MQRFQEQDQVFGFPDDWDVIHYDNEGYRKQHVADLHAVDFVARQPHGPLLFLEIKDYRGHEVQNRDKLRSGKLSQSLRQKVLWTYAGLIAGSRHDAGPFRRFAQDLATCPELKVVALVDLREPHLGVPLEQILSTHHLKVALRGVGVRPFVCTPQTLHERFGIECQNLARPALAGP